MVVCSAGCRRGGDERGDDSADEPHAAARSCTSLGYRWLRPSNGGVRRLPLVLADVLLSGGDRGDGHDQHHYPEHRPAARDPRSAARPDDRRQHGVLSGRTAARRAGSRVRGQLARPGVFGRQRRCGLPDCDRVGRGKHPCATSLPCGEQRDGYGVGKNSIEISGSSVIFTPGVLLSAALTSSGVLAACSFWARLVSTADRSTSMSMRVTWLPCTKGLVVCTRRPSGSTTTDNRAPASICLTMAICSAVGACGMPLGSVGKTPGRGTRILRTTFPPGLRSIANVIGSELVLMPCAFRPGPPGETLGCSMIRSCLTSANE